MGLQLYLIEILHQTTTYKPWKENKLPLYLIEILHQTTTIDAFNFMLELLYLIEILHQTTTVRDVIVPLKRCILSKFYIKPQRWPELPGKRRVVSYRNSTSNHNQPLRYWGARTVVSYRNSTSNHNEVRTLNGVLHVVSYRNSTSNHNSTRRYLATHSVVSYRNSTSNHNSPSCYTYSTQLYLIEILHQTTTVRLAVDCLDLLYLIEILHQTTTNWAFSRPTNSCILSKFYIKPQRHGLHA